MHTEKNREKIMRKIQKIFTNFLKKIDKNILILRKLGKIVMSFSSNVPPKCINA